jgi:hypothetical protein
MDPTERADIVSDQYYDWLVRNDYLLVQGQILAGQFMETFRSIRQASLRPVLR